jgi:cytochrome c biogenesis protein CcmG/thiol:disulfide interchange protein DsbE
MKRYLPIILFLVLFISLLKSLFQDEMEIPSPLIGKNMPNFSLTRLGENTAVTDQDILGEVALINVWATWCVGCKEEHQLLLSLAEEPSINLPIIGINWKDQDQLAIQWLDELGNPYQEILSDPIGNTAIDFGVYGAPESFLIDRDGIIRYKHIGPLTLPIWTNEIKPLIEELKQ